MSSPEVFEMLNAWKQAELGIFVFWASSSDKGPTVSFSFEGRLIDVDELRVVVIGEPSSRVAGTPKQQASISLIGARTDVLAPDRVRFSFATDAVLEIFLG
jgi:hypothetical protein